MLQAGAPRRGRLPVYHSTSWFAGMAAVYRKESSQTSSPRQPETATEPDAERREVTTRGSPR